MSALAGWLSKPGREAAGKSVENSPVEDESADNYRARLLAGIEREAADAGAALAIMRREIAALGDPEEREHAPLHEVRYLSTYALTPMGPGTLVDVGSSSIYGAALRELKAWRIEPVPILSLDYERDRLPFADESVDGVLLCEVIEHFVEDPLHCLIEVNRILKRDGFVVLTTPNVASWYAIHRALQQQHPSRWPFYAFNAPNSRNHIHAREYLVGEIRILLEAAGFGRLSVTTRDYGIAPPYRPIAGYSTEDRGESIYCRAYKIGPPLKRSVLPIYVRDVPFADE